MSRTLLNDYSTVWGRKTVREVHMRVHGVEVARENGRNGDAIECRRPDRMLPDRMLLVISRTCGIRPDRSLSEQIESHTQKLRAKLCAVLAGVNEALRAPVQISEGLRPSPVLPALAGQLAGAAGQLGHTRR